MFCCCVNPHCPTAGWRPPQSIQIFANEVVSDFHWALNVSRLTCFKWSVTTASHYLRSPHFSCLSTPFVGWQACPAQSHSNAVKFWATSANFLSCCHCCTKRNNLKQQDFWFGQLTLMLHASITFMLIMSLFFVNRSKSKHPRASGPVCEDWQLTNTDLYPESGPSWPWHHLLV